MEQEAEEFLPGLALNKDGSVTRKPSPVFPDAQPDTGNTDIMINPELDLWVRIYHPPKNKELGLQNPSRLPLVVYFHGGGFVFLKASTLQFHNWCSRLSSELGCILVSANYRLAPEHKLPAAYEDGFEILKWLSDQRPGLLDEVDASRLFVAGDSAGGNIAHHLSLRAAREHRAGAGLSFEIAGQILVQPGFGGVSRTQSELELPTGVEICDKCWELALPAGADRDHQFCNPVEEMKKVLGDGGGFFPKTMMIVGGLDLLRDKQLEYVKVLEECGRSVKLVKYEEAAHAFYFGESLFIALLLLEMAEFIKQ